MQEHVNGVKGVKIYDLEIGRVYFYIDYLVIEVKEGACFNHKQAQKLSVLTDLHFGNKPFGYISNRVNSYSLEPTDYIKIKEVFPNLKSFAVVAYNDYQKTSVRIEKMFFEGIAVFENLEDAVNWVRKKLAVS